MRTLILLFGFLAPSGPLWAGPSPAADINRQGYDVTEFSSKGGRGGGQGSGMIGDKGAAAEMAGRKCTPIARPAYGKRGRAFQCSDGKTYVKRRNCKGNCWMVF